MDSLLIEIQRKAVHLAWGLMVALLFWAGLIDWRFFLTIFLLVLAITLAYRATRKWARPLFRWFFDSFERRGERKKRFAGKSALQYHFAFFLVVLLFSKEAAIGAIIVLAVGDTLALWYGIFLGKVPVPWNPKKDLDARLVAAIACALLLLPVLPWWQGLAASLVGMLVESFDYKKGNIILDDNLLVPLATAITVLLLSL